MSRTTGIAVVVLVAAIAWLMAGSINRDTLIMVIGVLFGMLAGIPLMLLVATGHSKTQHHTHDVNVRFTLSQGRSVMAENNADDAVWIGGQSLRLDGNSAVKQQRLLAD